MCVYSMIADHGIDVLKGWPRPDKDPTVVYIPDPELARRISDLEELLRKAKIYDLANEEPDCELESKKLRLLELAAELGVRIKFPE